MLCGLSLVVKVVTGVKEVKEVKVNSKRSANVKKQLDYWIFHSSLLTVHFRKTFLNF